MKTCEICGSELISNLALSMHIVRYHKISIRAYYDKYLRTDKDGFCKICNKITRFIGLSGYSVYCCVKCSNSDPDKISYTRLNFFEKYGVDYPGQLSEVKVKIKETLKRKYGVDNFSKTDEGRKIHRINSIKQRENQISHGYNIFPMIGKQEPEFFKELQKHTQFKIIEQDASFRYIIGRYPDGHIKECKLFIQYDEIHHFNSDGSLKDNDIQCTKDLESIPGYRVFRVSQKKWEENKSEIIHEFQNLISIAQ